MMLVRAVRGVREKLEMIHSRVYKPVQIIANYVGALSILGLLSAASTWLIKKLPYNFEWPTATLLGIFLALLIVAVLAYAKNASSSSPMRNSSVDAIGDELASIRQKIAALESLHPRFAAIEQSLSDFRSAARDALDIEIAILREPTRRRAIRTGKRLLEHIEAMSKRQKGPHTLDEEKIINRRQLSIYTAASLCGLDLTKLTEHISTINKQIKSDVAYLQVNEDEKYFANGQEKRHWVMFMEATRLLVRSLEDAAPPPNSAEEAVEKLGKIKRTLT
jgi:hypothetical protein